MNADGLASSAAAALAVWPVVLLLAWLCTRPRRIDPALGPGRPGQEGWPVDTPALAARLVGFRRVEVVVYATLLDLAARGVLGLEVGERGPGWVCLADRTPPEVAALRPHERMVWEHVVARAGQADGSAPIDGLDFGSGEPTKAWQGRFERCVEEDARQRGLIGPRAPMWLAVLLGLALVVPAVLAGEAALAMHDSAAITFIVVGYFLLLRSVGVLLVLVPRGAGVQAAADCREIKLRLAAQPPAVPGQPGVRAAAYATALGVLGGSTPLAGASDSPVWSTLGGSWRQVRIVNARGTRFGISPRGTFAFLAATPFLVIWFVLLAWFTTLLTPSRWERAWPPLLVFTGWGLWALGVFLILRLVWRGIYDRTHPARVLTGPVVYLYTDTGEESSYYFAVDVGAAEAVKYPTGAAMYSRLSVGTVLRLEVTPKLGYVERCDIVATPAGQAVD